MELRRSVVLSAAGVSLGLASLEIIRRRSPVYRMDTEIYSHLAVGPGTRVSLVSTPEDWERIHQDVVKDLAAFPYIGLDTEWVTQKGYTGAVALLQIATYSGHSILIRLCTLDKVPLSLRDILSDPNITKVGVAVLDDSRKLLVDHSLDVVGCVDLRHIAVLQDSRPGNLGLESLALQYLNIQLDKDWRLRAGNWEAETLSARQINYAANDALVAVNILWVLLRRELGAGGIRSKVGTVSWSSDRLVAECRGYTDRFVDLRFSNKGWKEQNSGSSERGSKPSAAPVNMKLRFSGMRKSPLYHNCQLQAPDGQVLCTCDIKKAEWYVRKGIGDLISQDDPIIVRLKFEPSGRPEGKAGEYYLTVKPNLCVVCGKQDSYLRKNVVPHEYRRYFPAVMKDHQSHDVVLLCVPCHQLSNMFDAELRRTLAEECSAPIGTENDVKLRDNFQLKRVKSAGRALKSAADKLPAERRRELEQVLAEHFGAAEVTAEMIEEASSCRFQELNEEYTPHSRGVVQHYLKEGGLINLEVRWRKHFLATMRPRFLPELWSVNHQEERLGVKAAENRIDREQYMLATQGVSGDQSIDLEAYRRIRKPQLGVNPETAGVEQTLGGEQTYGETWSKLSIREETARQGQTCETVETIEIRETSETRETSEASLQTLETLGDGNLSSDRESVEVGSSLEDWETFSETSEAFVTVETREQNDLI